MSTETVGILSGFLGRFHWVLANALGFWIGLYLFILMQSVVVRTPLLLEPRQLNFSQQGFAVVIPYFIC